MAFRPDPNEQRCGHRGGRDESRCLGSGISSIVHGPSSSWMRHDVVAFPLTVVTSLLHCAAQVSCLYLPAVMSEFSEVFDVIVIGAGHAGCEAALAAARAGCSTLILTPNLDRIGFMPCNPSIGGPAKGHLVREGDALGGEMGRAIDRTAIQIRLLNSSKGPAVRALRAQADKPLYQMAMKEALERQPGLTVRQELVSDVELEPAAAATARARSILTSQGNRYLAGAVVVTAGTFLRGAMIAGEWRGAGGRAGG